MNDNLDKSIISSLIFFDIFDYPLTKLEIWKFLYKNNYNNDHAKLSLFDIEKTLNNKLINKIENKNGFYFLPGKKNIIKIRNKRYKQSFYKFQKAKKASKIFSLLPFIKMIAIGNFMPSNNTKKESDLDFFIVTKKNRIWITRFFCVLISQLLGWRPTKKNKKDKICLSFFISEKNLDLRNIAIAKEKINDIYLCYWIATLYPLYNKGKTYENFVSQNSWIKKYLPNFAKIIPIQQRKINPCFFSFIFLLLNFNFLEKIAKKIQLKIMPENLKKLAGKSDGVIINDDILKFHENDRRKYYRNKFLNNYEKIYKKNF
ncbi:MAG: hypothetical protein GWO87_00130 [Xanthomonadaceae bacterium]|nr:hypothetical protein [Rhodospirillaceae bacterium]NIA17587.1 hypothetical protein [Xanthomonadaceae bacterium]